MSPGTAPELLAIVSVNCRLLAPATFALVPLLVAVGVGVARELGVGVGVVEG